MMETYHRCQQQYQQPYSAAGCELFCRPTDGHAAPCAGPARVDRQRGSLLLQPGYHADLSPRLRCHIPAYRCSVPRAWRHVSPPAVTRCVSTLPRSPFSADLHHTSSSSQPRPPPHAAAGTAPPPASRSTTSSGGARCLDGGWADAGVCLSLVDTTQRPAALNDAVCMYIDYLTRHNDRVIGDLLLGAAVAAGDDAGGLDSYVVDDQLYRDVICRPASFPTTRFRDWLHVYSIDIEITDPDGRRLAEATFPGRRCRCKPAAAAGGWTVYATDSQWDQWSPERGAYWLSLIHI